MLVVSMTCRMVYHAADLMWCIINSLSPNLTSLLHERLNALPSSKKQEATVAAIYTPMKYFPLHAHPPLLPTPLLHVSLCPQPLLRCRLGHQDLDLPFCFQSNHFPPRYAFISDDNLPIELDHRVRDHTSSHPNSPTRVPLRGWRVRYWGEDRVLPHGIELRRPPWGRWWEWILALSVFLWIRKHTEIW